MTILATINGLAIAADTPVYLIASAVPGSPRVFTRNRMDWCCKGLMPLASHCAEVGIDPATFLAEVAAEAASAPAGPNWAARPTPELVAHILTFHDAHRRDLPVLAPLIAELAASQGERRPALRDLAAVFPTFVAETYRHLEMEERDLFPAIAAGRTGELAAIVQQLRDEHENHDHRLVAFRDWCEDYRTLRRFAYPLPNDPDRPINDLHLRLEVFEGELMEHMHLENNLLFPRLQPAAAVAAT
jgi:regulator of cell morphogenesis and NO signaling